MNEKKEIITTKNGSSIEIDPGLLVDSIGYINKLVNAHISLIENLQNLIKMYVENGVDQNQAGKIALEFHRRAADKALDITKYKEANSSEKTETNSNKPNASNGKAESNGKNI